MKYKDCTSMLDYALYYASLGWPVFPLQGKVPFSSKKWPDRAHGHLSATTEIKTIKSWWEKTPTANIGFAVPQDIVVIDVDNSPLDGKPREAKQGSKNFKILTDQFGLPPRTLLAKSARGGYHYIFKSTKVFKPNDDIKLAGLDVEPSDIDLKTKGGYIVMPPSKAHGGEYKWLLCPDDGKLAELPAWLEPIEANKTKHLSDEGRVELLEGTRDSALVRFGGWVRDQGFDADVLRSFLQAVNEHHCVPPYDDTYIEAKVQSLMKYAPSRSILDDLPNIEGLRGLIKPLSSFEEKEAKWLIQGWIPEEQITLIAAEGGVGKTTVWCDIISAISSGQNCLFDTPDVIRFPQKVMFLTTEDSVSKKLKKKLRLAGANMDNIVTVDFADDKEGLLNKVKLGTPELAEIIRDVRPALCVFDPIQGFLPKGVQMSSRNEMRDCMAPLVSLGEECGTSFLIVCHTNKRKGASGRDRLADSADIWDVSRSVIMSGYTEKDGVRYLSNEKNNYADLQKTVLFSVGENGRSMYVGSSWKKDRDYVAQHDQAYGKPKTEACEEAILDIIQEAGGKILTAELDARLSEKGFKGITVKRVKADMHKDESIRYGRDGSDRYTEFGPKHKGDERLDSTVSSNDTVEKETQKVTVSFDDTVEKETQKVTVSFDDTVESPFLLDDQNEKNSVPNDTVKFQRTDAISELERLLS